MCRDGSDYLLMHVLSAVDLDGRAIDIARAVREEERDCGRDLLGLADAAQRDGRGHGLLALVGELAAHDLGVDGPGRQDIDGDAEGAHLSSTATTHTDDCRLGGCVDALGERPAAIECRDRGGVDDPADAPGDHPLGGCLEHEVGAGDVDRHDPLELLEFDFVQRYRAGDARKVDQGHDRRQLLVDSCERRCDGVFGRDVRGYGEDVLVPRVLELLLDLGEAVGVVVDEGDVPAALGEGTGNDPTDTRGAARPGNDCCLLCWDGIGAHDCSLLEASDAMRLWPLVMTSVTTCASARVSWANRPRKSPSTKDPRLWYVPGPALPPYRRREGPAYESSRTRRCSRADRPHRLIRDDDLWPGGDLQQRLELRETGLGRLTKGTTIGFADAVQRHQAGSDDLRSLRLDIRVVLAEKSSPLGMSNLDVPTTELCQDRGRDLAGLGAVRRGRHVLGAPTDAGAGKCFRGRLREGEGGQIGRASCR